MSLHWDLKLPWNPLSVSSVPRLSDVGITLQDQRFSESDRKTAPVRTCCPTYLLPIMRGSRSFSEHLSQEPGCCRLSLDCHPPPAAAHAKSVNWDEEKHICIRSKGKYVMSPSGEPYIHNMQKNDPLVHKEPGAPDTQESIQCTYVSPRTEAINYHLNKLSRRHSTATYQHPQYPRPHYANGHSLEMASRPSERLPPRWPSEVGHLPCLCLMVGFERGPYVGGH